MHVLISDGCFECKGKGRGPMIGNSLFAVQDINIVTGDPVKFGLALVSIAYCVVLLVQHYVLYPERKPSHYDRKLAASVECEEGSSLLGGLANGSTPSTETDTAV